MCFRAVFRSIECRTTYVYVILHRAKGKIYTIYIYIDVASYAPSFIYVYSIHLPIDMSRVGYEPLYPGAITWFKPCAASLCAVLEHQDARLHLNPGHHDSRAHVRLPRQEEMEKRTQRLVFIGFKPPKRGMFHRVSFIFGL